MQSRDEETAGTMGDNQTSNWHLVGSAVGQFEYEWARRTWWGRAVLVSDTLRDLLTLAGLLLLFSPLILAQLIDRHIFAPIENEEMDGEKDTTDSEQGTPGRPIYKEEYRNEQ